MGKITIIDYGMGNLRSVQKACEFIGLSAEISDDVQAVEKADALILPGVGAFGDAMTHLNEKGLTPVIKEFVKTGKPFLGICLGMQLIFDKSFEHGTHEGLGLVGGDVVEFKLDGLKVPHMGWNNLDARQNPLFDKSDDQYVYFVHSFYADGVSDDDVIATATYGHPFVAAVRHENVFGLQFHPEKSGDVGLNMLRNFGKLI